VQFHETDFDFASRLMDEIGAGYFFQHGENDHTLTVTGANADFPQVPGEALVVRAAANDINTVTDWRVSGTLQPGKHVGHDFDMLKPSTLLQATAQTRLSTPDAGTWEVYRWGAGQTVQPDGDPSTIGMEQHEAQADSAEGRTEMAALFAGGKVKVQEGLSGSPMPWLITAIRHEAMDETQLVGDGQTHYANSFVAIPGDRTWRNSAPRRRPAMPALQSAIVTGPSGEEIHCDQHGRVKVQFLWDRYGKKDQNTTCYVRVSQPWAGKWGGTWFLPRIGDEVLVGFLDGDPDKPVVLGSIHNQEAPPPYGLPSLNTQSGITTRSSKGGSKDNANLLRFEDKKGSEEVYIQAEFDMNVLVKHDLSTTVRDGDETRLVKSRQAHHHHRERRDADGQYRQPRDHDQDRQRHLHAQHRQPLADAEDGEVRPQALHGQHEHRARHGKLQGDDQPRRRHHRGDAGHYAEGRHVRAEARPDGHLPQRDDAEARRHDAAQHAGPDDLGEGHRHAAGRRRHRDDRMSSMSATRTASKLLVALAPLLPRLELDAGGTALLAGIADAEAALARLEAAGRMTEALRLLAHALPKREAVWWACMCARSVPDPADGRRTRRRWRPPKLGRRPDEAARRAAMAAAERAAFRSTEAWAAVGAFWSGGSMSPAGQPVVPPAEHSPASPSPAPWCSPPSAPRRRRRRPAIPASSPARADIGTGGAGRIAPEGAA
jgi:type VI secretion system VgrG family protein